MNRLVAVAAVGLLGCSGGGQVGDDDTGGADARELDARVDAGIDAPTDASPDALTPMVTPEIDGRITINEFMASNALTVVPASGPALDWIELYNPTEQAIPLHGYALTDDLAMPLKSGIGAGVIIPAHGRVVLWADDSPTAGPSHLGFHLASETGMIGLARPDGSFIDRVTYGDQTTDVSSAREPDGADHWAAEWLASPGAANPGTGGQPAGAEVLASPPEAVPPAGDLSERLLGYDALPSIALTITPANMDALRAHPLDTVPAQIAFGGRTYGPVGVHLKGHNSFEPIDAKPSLRVKIDEYVEDARLLGLKDLTLNNMDDDLSMMHERLAYMISRAAGVPSSRATHALLTLNGVSYGLYANVETIKKKMIGRWFTDDTGPLYGVPDVDFAPAYVARFELEAGTDDRHLITGLANALTLPSADEAIAAAGNYIDMDEFLRFWAMASIVAQFDSLPYSIPGDDIMLYADPTSDRLNVIPWGMDETFYSGQIDVSATVYSVLARRCKESPGCYQAYADQTWALLAMTESMGFAAERNRVIAQIAPYVAADTKKPYTDAQVAESQGALYWFINDRRHNLGAMIPPPSPAMKQSVAGRRALLPVFSFGLIR